MDVDRKVLLHDSCSFFPLPIIDIICGYDHGAFQLRAASISDSVTSFDVVDDQMVYSTYRNEVVSRKADQDPLVFPNFSNILFVTVSTGYIFLTTYMKDNQYRITVISSYRFCHHQGQIAGGEITSQHLLSPDLIGIASPGFYFISQVILQPELLLKLVDEMTLGEKEFVQTACLFNEGTVLATNHGIRYYKQHNSCILPTSNIIHSLHVTKAGRLISLDTQEFIVWLEVENILLSSIRCPCSSSCVGYLNDDYAIVFYDNQLKLRCMNTGTILQTIACNGVTKIQTSGQQTYVLSENKILLLVLLLVLQSLYWLT